MGRGQEQEDNKLRWKAALMYAWRSAQGRTEPHSPEGGPEVRHGGGGGGLIMVTHNKNIENKIENLNFNPELLIT